MKSNMSRVKTDMSRVDSNLSRVINSLVLWIFCLSPRKEPLVIKSEQQINRFEGQ